ncbi:MAG: hypothetical protein Q8O19_03750, partial [Rectinemataceae bacterium]|nr:hypothetical protein [Rectinemataceae bacterium]
MKESETAPPEQLSKVYSDKVVRSIYRRDPVALVKMELGETPSPGRQTYGSSYSMENDDCVYSLMLA